MTKRPLGVVLYDDAQRRLGFACQPDGAVALEPETDVEADASSVFAHFHGLTPDVVRHCPSHPRPLRKASNEEPCADRLALRGVKDASEEVILSMRGGRINRAREFFPARDTRPQRMREKAVGLVWFRTDGVG